MRNKTNAIAVDDKVYVRYGGCGTEGFMFVGWELPVLDQPTYEAFEMARDMAATKLSGLDEAVDKVFNKRTVKRMTYSGNWVECIM